MKVQVGWPARISQVGAALWRARRAERAAGPSQEIRGGGGGRTVRDPPILSNCRHDMNEIQRGPENLQGQAQSPERVRGLSCP
eukprot:5450755-Pyramimonas_sp.AAC.1